MDTISLKFMSENIYISIVILSFILAVVIVDKRII